jgi:MFS-type transporter involved in bile tolerance (Atg22 family)
VVIVSFRRALVGALTITLLLVLRNVVHPPDQPNAALADFALVAGGVTVGAFLAAVLTPKFGRRLGPVGWTCLVMLLAGCLMTPTLFTLSVIPIVLTSPLVGLSNQSAKICSDSIIQRRIPDEALGRVFSIVDLAVNVGVVVGVCLVAFFAPADGVTTVGYCLLGATYVVGAAVYWVTRDRSLETDPVFGLAG